MSEIPRPAGEGRRGAMAELCSPDSEGELAILKSVLDDAGLPYFVHNDHFGSLLAGPRVAMFNRKRILVPEAALGEARRLLAGFQPAADDERRRPAAERPYTGREKLRMLAEFLLFGWFLPGKRAPRRPSLRLVKGARTERE